MNAIDRDQGNENDCCYFDRPAEQLVLEGYRHWTAGYQNNSVVAWELAWHLYESLLGPTNAAPALTELWHFVRAIGTCSACPLRYSPSGAHHVCRDECLVLGLIAGIQHGDDVAVKKCLDILSCPVRYEPAAMAAGSFALVLKGLNQVLLPIPLTVIDGIDLNGSGNTIH